MAKVFGFFLVVAFVNAVSAVSTLPFTENFEANSSSWVYGSSATPIWSASGGVGNSGFISAPAIVSGTGFGAIVFRANDANNASGDAFVGNWLAAGVSTFSFFVRHDADVALNFYARFDAGAGRAASSTDFLVNPNTWTFLSLPIVNQTTSFQSYGAAGAGQGAFDSIFSGIQNVQVALSLDPVNAGKSLNLGLDSISIIPEPGVPCLLLIAASLAQWGRRNSRAFQAGLPRSPKPDGP